MTSLIDFNKLHEAAKDFKYLLDRGYPLKNSLEIVSVRWSLKKEERILLFRCIHPSKEAINIRLKQVGPSYINKRVLIVDTYNVLLTLKTASLCENVYLCDDNMVRDILSTKGKASKDRSLYTLLPLITDALDVLRPEKTIFVVDKQVSMSKELCTQISIQAATKRLFVETILAEKSDKTIIEITNTCKETVVASSDILILRHARRVFDLAGYIIARKWTNKILNIRL